MDKPHGDHARPHPLDLVDRHGMCRLLQIGYKRLRRLRQLGIIPYYEMGDHTIRYDPAQVAAALERCRCNGINKNHHKARIRKALEKSQTEAQGEENVQ